MPRVLNRGFAAVISLGLAGLCVPGAALAQDEAVLEAIVDYMDFAPYEAGIILPAQLDQEVFEAAMFVDTRSAAQFAAGTIPGARHIEWRQVPAQLDQLPDTGMVILFCNTGTLSAQAAFAARLLGYENVVVMQGGFTSWQTQAAYFP